MGDAESIAMLLASLVVGIAIGTIIGGALAQRRPD